MKNRAWDKKTTELLFELGYDKQHQFLCKKQRNRSFMLQLEMEILLEAQRYIEFLEDCSDDYYLKIKNNN